MSNESPPTLDTKDCEKLLDVLRLKAGTPKKTHKAVRNYCMALLMLEAGLRVGELVSLQVSDLFFNREPVRTIFIKPHMTKNKVAHSIPVSSHLADCLKSYGLTWNLLDPERGNDYAFTNVSTDRSITTRQVERIICAAGWKAFGRPVHPHMLRHTAATRLMRVTNINTVQQILGHKFLSSTQVYCHPNEEDKRQAIESASRPGEQTVSPEVQQLEHPQEQQCSHRGPVPASPSKPSHVSRS